MERTETETRQRLNNKIEQLESELTSMKSRLEQEVAQRHALGRSMDVCIFVFISLFVSVVGAWLEEADCGASIYSSPLIPP